MTAITGIAGLPDGSVFANGAFTFTRLPTAVVSQGGVVVTPTTISVTADGSGAVDFELLSGNYQGTESSTGVSFPFNVPDELTADFADCVDAATANLNSDIVQQVLDARDEAVAAAALIVYPDSFATNTTPGTTDMTAAILAAATAAAGGGTVYGTGNVYAVSTNIDLSALTGIRFVGLKFKAIGTWSASEAFFSITLGSAAVVDITFEGCDFEGNHLANGVTITNGARVKFERCTGHGFPLYAIKTQTKAGELVISNCSFNQYNYGESGWNVAVNRTAALLDIDTDDFKIVHTNASYCLYPLRIRSTAEFGLIDTCHFFNDGYTPASGQPYNALIEGKNLTFSACDFDNGLVRLDAYALSNPALPWSTVTFDHCFFRINGAGINVNGLELYNSTGTSVDLNGLVLNHNTGHGYASVNDVLLFTGPYLSPLRWTGMGNIMENGAAWGGINAISLPINAAVELQDSDFTLVDNLDVTKKARFKLDNLTSGTTRTYLLPDNNNGTVALDNVNNDFTGQNTFSGATNNFGTSTGNSFVNLGTGATTSGNTKAISIGTAGLSGSVTNITIGSGVSGSTGSLTLNLAPKIPSYTVAGLPTGSAGMRATVTNSNVAASGNFGAVVAGGGSNTVPVYHDGTNWRIG